MLAGFTVLIASLVMMALPAQFSPYAWLAIAGAITGCGMGLAVPAANNASLQLAPDQVAAIAGLRGMFRQSGAIVAISVTTAIIARSSHPGVDQAYVFLVFAGLLVLMLPLVKLVPEHHGTWLSALPAVHTLRRRHSSGAYSMPRRSGGPSKRSSYGASGRSRPGSAKSP
jgi:MFS family permease